MRYLSVCSGIEAATCAWSPLGWQPLAFAEIDAFPSAVLAHHYPDVPNIGDMTKIATGETDVGPFELLVGGTPCQSFSVAGLRKGLADPRGNLALAYLEIARRYRPKWLVWENVPGVLSSNGGWDFGSILGGMGELGYGFAYRVLDAQFFGVPQRRRRVFVVGCLGDWRGAAAVLFERHSLSGNSAPRREAREDAAPTLSARTQGGGGLGTDTELDGGLIAQGAIKGAAIGREPENGPQYGEWLTDGTCYTLNSTEQHAVAFSAKDYGADHGDTSPTLRAMGHDGSHANSGGQVAVAFTGDVTHALNTANNGKMSSEDGTGRGVPTVAQQIYQDSEYGVQAYDSAGALRAGRIPEHQMVNIGNGVRRLTPRECERLQGFPDDYTAIPYRNGIAADGPRYKALGNSMAVPVVRWIGERINAVRAIQTDTEAA